MTAAAATFYSYPEFFESEDLPLPTQEGGTLENQNGDTMFVPLTLVIIDNDEEELMANKPTYGRELLGALKLSWPILVIVIVAVFGFFQLTQNRVDASRDALESRISELRVELASQRDNSSAENTALRNDMNQGFNRVADKLDEVNKNMTTIFVDQAKKDTQNKN